MTVNLQTFLIVSVLWLVHNHWCWTFRAVPTWTENWKEPNIAGSDVNEAKTLEAEAEAEAADFGLEAEAGHFGLEAGLEAEAGFEAEAESQNKI